MPGEVDRRDKAARGESAEQQHMRDSFARWGGAVEKIREREYRDSDAAVYIRQPRGVVGGVRGAYKQSADELIWSEALIEADQNIEVRAGRAERGGEEQCARNSRGDILAGGAVGRLDIVGSRSR